LFTFFVGGGVQARLFESSSVKKGGESSEAKQLLYSSSFFLQDFNRRKISSTQFFLPARFQPKKNLINPILSSCKISTEALFDHTAWESSEAKQLLTHLLSSCQISTQEKSRQPGLNTSCKLLASCKHKASLFIFVFCFAGIASTRAEKECR
jgi:hypothetical protein